MFRRDVMLFLAICVFALLGCTVSEAQTTTEKADQCYDFLKQKFPSEFPPGGTTGGTTTGGSTTGGTTTGGSTTGGTTTGGPPPSDRVLVWSTTHETGSLQSSWNFGRQAVYNSGNGKTSLVEIANAKSGRFALLQSVTADDTSGARCFITGDKDNKAIPKELYMTAWIYIPKAFKVGSWWNHMQLKERTSVSSNDGYVDPTLHLSLASNNTGLYQRIYNWIPGQRYYINQDPSKIVYLPIAKWTKIEWYVDSKTSGGSTWLKQDDVLIISRNNIKTIANDNHVLNFSVDCYGGRGPGFVQYYWDDVELSTPR